MNETACGFAMQPTPHFHHTEQTRYRQAPHVPFAAKLKTEN